MEESESRVHLSACRHTAADTVASRVLDSPQTYHQWASEHDHMIRRVSSEHRLLNQVVALRQMAFSLVHRRAMMEYIRERQLTGRKRMHLFALFYGNRDYCNAVLTEHNNFVRCSSSYVCTNHIGEYLMEDAAFDEPMQLYEEWFMEYFRGFCDVELAATEEERERLAPLAALRPLLKHRLVEARAAILAMPKTPDREWREVKIRKPNGDTQRLKTIFGAG